MHLDSLDPFLPDALFLFTDYSPNSFSAFYQLLTRNYIQSTKQMVPNANMVKPLRAHRMQEAELLEGVLLGPLNTVVTGIDSEVGPVALKPIESKH